jgi:5-methylcytosine-specific restriction endonuclease McrA
MSLEKKKIRDNFKRLCLKRDGYQCRVCGDVYFPLDIHHITPRKQLPNGGYVVSNGITLCRGCHRKAEDVINGQTIEGFAPADLYSLIKSSYEQARTSDALFNS